jgi:hypothetical protein
MAGSIRAAAKELARYKLEQVGLQEVRWENGGTVQARDYNFSTEKGTKIIKWEQDLYSTERSLV